LQKNALNRSAESIAADFADERALLRIDDSPEMRALLVEAGLTDDSPLRAPHSVSPGVGTGMQLAWPPGHDVGAIGSAKRARERIFTLCPREPLWPVQREGIAFIQRVERERPRGYMGGIIADEMGLGKTLQILALLLEEHQETCRVTGSPYGKSTLFTLEKGLVATFCEEIDKHFGKDAFGPIAYLTGGPQDTRDATPDRIVSCFRVAVTTYPMLVTAHAWHTSGRKHELGPALFDTVWHRVVADEAHVASNPSSARFRALCAIKAHFHWAQTGTPVLNDINSVCALLHFVGGEAAAADVPLDMTARVERVAGTAVAAKSASEHNVRVELSVQNLLHVRAVLSDVMLRRLQPVERHVQTTCLADFETPAERVLYAHYYAKFCADSRATENAGGTEMRHTTVDISDATTDGVDTSASTPLNMVSVDILHLRQICAAHVVVRDLDLPPTLLLDAGHAEVDRTRSNTTARILAHAPPSVPSLAYLAAARIMLAQDPRFAARLNVPNQDAAVDTDADYARVSQHAARKWPVLWNKYSAEQRRQLRAILRHVRTRILPSIGTKMRMFVRHYAHEVPSEDKFIIFSDWVRVLEHAQRVFASAGLNGVLLTGEQETHERTATLRRLERDPNVRALLGSMQVVANGLNIACANHVSIVAQWWNPQTTKQGQYRVRRPNQTKPCHDYNVIIRGTVEEDVRRIACEKEYIARIVLESDPETLRLVDDLATKRAQAPEVVGATPRDVMRVLLRQVDV
jgi:hypothetical protein